MLWIASRPSSPFTGPREHRARPQPQLQAPASPSVFATAMHSHGEMSIPVPREQAPRERWPRRRSRRLRRLAVPHPARHIKRSPVRALVATVAAGEVGDNRAMRAERSVVAHVRVGEHRARPQPQLQAPASPSVFATAMHSHGEMSIPVPREQAPRERWPRRRSRRLRRLAVPHPARHIKRSPVRALVATVAAGGVHGGFTLVLRFDFVATDLRYIKKRWT